jgi:hypothetical protein
MSEVVGTVVTAIVGLVGVSALLWTARLERTASVRNVLVSAAAEHRRLALIDKRQTYARYFGLVESTRHAVITIRGFHDRSMADPSAVPAAADAVGQLFASYYELALIAPAQFSQSPEPCSKRSETTTPGQESANRR